MISPPRPRRKRVRPSRAVFAYHVVLNAGALVVTLLLLRLVIQVVQPASSVTTSTVLTVTAPLVWPLHQMVQIADANASFALTCLAAFVWLVLLGIIRGWEAESQRQRPEGSRRRP